MFYVLPFYYFVLVFFSPFSIAITSLGEEGSNLSALRTFIRFVLVWFCRFPLPLGVWEGLRFVIVSLPELFLLLFCGQNELVCVLFIRLLILRVLVCAFFLFLLVAGIGCDV